jgi:hypothetical protein
MSTLYRIVRRVQGGVEVIAEIRNGIVTGSSADMVRERLIHYGYPKVPLEEALRRFRSSAPTYISFERLDSDDD